MSMSIPESPYLTTNPPTQQTVFLSSRLLPANVRNCLTYLTAFLSVITLLFPPRPTYLPVCLPVYTYIYHPRPLTEVYYQS